MQIDTHMKDGRTTYRFRTRGQLIALVNRKIDKLGEDDVHAIRCLRHLQENGSWMPAKVMYVNPSSISFIEQVAPEQAHVMDELLPANRERQAA